VEPGAPGASAFCFRTGHAAFGPLRSGDDGAILFEVMLGDPRSWGDRPELFAAALDDQGAEALPDVPLDYPDWLADLRHHWVGADDSEPAPTAPPPTRTPPP